mgnify:CR=1 FL=1
MRKKLNLPGLENSISFGQTRRWRNTENEYLPEIDQINHFRLSIFHFFIFVVVLVFLARLFGLTVIAGSKNRELAENNRIKLVETEAERGRIFDRNGIVVAY